MTAQINDILLYDDKKLQISAINSEHPLVTLERFGLHPVAASTACWRGYTATLYIDAENRLGIKKLTVNLPDEVEPIAINGTSGKKVKISDFENLSADEIECLISGNTVYANLDLPLNFTGSIIACDGFKQEYYVHMGFHEPYKYDTVFEFFFKNGSCKEVKDLSDQAKFKRTEMKKSEHRGCMSPKKIKQRFSLGYAEKWI